MATYTLWLTFLDSSTEHVFKICECYSVNGRVKIIHRNRNAKVLAWVGVSSLLWLPDGCGPMFNVLPFDGLLVSEAHDCNMVFFSFPPC